MARKNVNLLGRRFNNIYPTKVVGTTSTGDSIWECKCDCGDDKCEKIIQVRARYLLDRQKKSCNKNEPKNQIRVCNTVNAPDKYPVRMMCSTCLRKTPHMDGVCSWH